MIREYLEAAMAKAVFKTIDDPEPVFGEIPLCQGVWATGSNVQECRRALLIMQAPSPTTRRQGFKLVTFGAGGHFSRRNIDKTSSLLEGDDLERFARRG